MDSMKTKSEILDSLNICGEIFGQAKIISLTRRHRLSPRQAQVMALLWMGQSRKEIAARLAISVFTVRFHMDQLRSKIGRNYRREFANFFCGGPCTF
jgi:DNA-binding CsgD family transcriptional regulator